MFNFFIIIVLNRELTVNYIKLLLITSRNFYSTNKHPLFKKLIKEKIEEIKNSNMLQDMKNKRIEEIQNIYTLINPPVKEVKKILKEKQETQDYYFSLINQLQIEFCEKIYLFKTKLTKALIINNSIYISTIKQLELNNIIIDENLNNIIDGIEEISDEKIEDLINLIENKKIKESILQKIQAYLNINFNNELYDKLVEKYSQNIEISIIYDELIAVKKNIDENISILHRNRSNKDQDYTRDYNSMKNQSQNFRYV